MHVNHKDITKTLSLIITIRKVIKIQDFSYFVVSRSSFFHGQRDVSSQPENLFYA